MKRKPKVALVYDRVNKIGGAERVLEVLHQIWPEAPIYTSLYNKQTARWADQMVIEPSFLQKFKWARRHHEYFAWLMPSVFESFDFKQFDIVISITSAEAKGIITSPQTLHICYLLTPTRYLWSHTHFYLRTGFLAKNALIRFFALRSLSQLRQWDFIAAQRPDKMVTISNNISKRLDKYYRRQADRCIYPPVTYQTKKSKIPVPYKNYYLVVSRLVSYKRIDLVIKACNQLKRNLVIVGEGSQQSELKKMASKSIVFLGKVSDKKLTALYQHCQALVFPAEEDFGIVCVEAQAAGKPVVAYSRGGAGEIIQNHTTGVFFNRQTVKSVVEAIQAVEQIQIKSTDTKKNAQRFSSKRFKRQFLDFVEASWQEHLKINQ